MKISGLFRRNVGQANSLSYNGWWLRLAIVAATLAAAAVLGLRPTGRLAQLVLLGTLGLGALTLILRYLPWGVLALIPVSFLVDYPIKTGTNVVFNATFVLTALLLAAWALRMLAGEKKLRLARSPANLPAALFIGATLLAWLSGFLPWLPAVAERPSLPAQLGAILIYTLSIGALWLVGNLLTEPRQIKIMTWVFLGCGTVYLLAMVIPWSFTYVNKWFVDNLSGNSMYWTWLAAAALGQALFNHRLARVLRGGLLAVAVLILLFGLLKKPDWLSGWLPPLIAVMVLLWLRDWRLGAAATLIGVFILWPSLSGFYAIQVNTPTQEWSNFTRVATWPIIFDLFKLNPLTGLGPAAYPFYTPYYSYLGYFVRFNTHNNYFDIALQSGLLGLVTFLWLAGTLLWLGWKLRSQANDCFTKAYANTALAGWIATLVAGTFVDWFLPLLYNIGIPGFQGSIYAWLFLGGLISLAKPIGKKEEELT